jgi:Ribbon-helix-helix protein, copG family
MIRTQIQLTETESEALREASRRTGLSIAELIRQSVDRYLDEVGPAGRENAGRLSALQVAGRFHSEVTDVSLRHDDYLDEAYLSARP